MLDLEENHGEVSNIQSSLANSFDNVDDFDWEPEMTMMLDSDVSECTRSDNLVSTSSDFYSV